MKLKRWVFPAAIALLLLLVIPIPTGVLKDGGTKSYTALSYRIVDWNHLYGEGNIYDKTVIYPFPMNFMSIDALLDQEAENFKTPVSDPASDQGDDPVAEPKALAFSAQYARVGMFNEGLSTPKTIRSLDELKEYYKTFDFSLRNQQEDAAVGLPEGWVGYDDAYFAERILVPVIQIESSGSFRHEATAARLTAQNDLVIEIDRVYPKEHVYTTDIGVWHIFVELDKSVVLAEEDQLIIYVDGIDSADPTVTASSSGRSASMSLSFPDGWEAAAADPSNDGSFGISFWPVGHPEGKLTLQYQKAFGVCGVGLTEKEITLGRHKAYQGSYDGKESWDFIRFVGTKDDYVVTNDGADVWWKEYGAEATEILGTAQFGGGVVSGENSDPEPKEIGFSAQYVRTDRQDSEYGEPLSVKIIRSVDELTAYYEENKERYDMQRKADTPYSDETIGFPDACDKYDAAYFKDRVLIMVLAEEGSGSIRHEVKQVSLTEAGGKRQMAIEIDPIVPEAGTCDMAFWHILIEPEAGVGIADESDITVFYNEKNLTD